MGVVFSSHVIFTPASTAPPGGYPELPVIYSIGSMANGSNHLILSDAAGGTYFRSVTPPLRVPFQIGDKVIVEIGGEAGGGQRGTMGVGGAVAATDPGNYFRALDAPKALVATILNITGGNDLTLDATAFTATTNARVFRDNTDGMNAENGAALAGSTINWPAGTFAQYDYVQNILADNITLQGQGKRITQLYQPKGARRGGISWGGRVGLITQDLTIWGNAKWQGFGMADDIGSLFFVGVGVWIFNSSSCITRRVESFNVFQKAGWSEGGSGNQFIDCNMIQEEALQSYNAQWYFGASDATNCIISNCTFYGVYLAPGYETFRSSGTQFLNCTSQNGCFSTNSSGNWLIENAVVTITENSWLNANSFEVTQAAINVNSNIVPPSPDLELGGILRNFTFTVLGPVDRVLRPDLAPTGNYLKGVSYGSYTPNILFDGGTLTYPLVDNYALNSGVFVTAISMYGYAFPPPYPPTHGIVVQDWTTIGFVPSFGAHMGVDSIPGTVTNCTGTIKKNGVLLTGNYIGFGDTTLSGINYWGVRAYTFAAVGATAIRLRRTGATPGEQDFTTISTGDLDLAAIAAFQAGSVGASLFCVTLYDQIGTNHMTQATAGAQPAFILSGLNGHPILTFDGIDDHLTGSSAISIGPNSVSTLINLTPTGAQQSIYTAGTTSIIHTATANQLTINNGAALTSTTTGFDSSWRLTQAAFSGTASAMILVDFQETITGNAGTNTGTAVPDIGSGVGFFKGSLIEVCVQTGIHSGSSAFPLFAWQKEFYGF